MKQEEIIELLKDMQSPLEDYAELVGAPAFTYGHKYVYPYPEDYAIEEAIKALKEVQQYRKIGTVEECQEAREKQKPKRPIDTDEDYGFFICPVCRKTIYTSDDFESHKFCLNCGQAILQEDEL